MKFEESIESGVHAHLSVLVGEWKGPAKTWFEPDVVGDEADVLYINFKKPSVADDSELTDDDVIIRYEGDEVIGLTVLNVSKRNDI